MISTGIVAADVRRRIRTKGGEGQLPFFANPWFIAALLALLTIAVFWPVTHNDFVNFDDQVYVTENAHVLHGLSAANVHWAFTNLEAGFWHPLTWLSIMLDCQLYGLHPGGHHLTSLILHIVNTILLFLLLRRMTSALWPSAFVAALFGLHPLHVETVAWAADRKDVLSTTFLFLTLLAYARYAEEKGLNRLNELNKLNEEKPTKAGGPKLEIRNSKLETNSKSETRKDKAKAIEPQRHRGTEKRVLASAENPASSIQDPGSGRSYLPSSIFYLLSLALFALGLMSKTMLVTVPFLMLLLDFWPLNRFRLNTEHWKPKTFAPLLLEKLPFIALSIIAGLLTVHAEKGVGALGTATRFPLTLRAENALTSCWIYIRQMFWPADLAVFYPYPNALPILSVTAAAVILFLVTFLCFKFARRCPFLLTGWLWYLIALGPVIGIIQVGAHAHADRYSYIPLIGLFIIIAWLCEDAIHRFPRTRPLLSAGASALVIACAIQGRHQIAIWRNSETLFRHAVRVTTRNYLAYNNLGIELARSGNLHEAIDCFHTAIDLKPDDPDAHANLGKILASQRKLPEAMAEYQTALNLQPGNSTVLNNLGVAEVMLGKTESALLRFREAIRQKPDDPAGHNNLGLALLATKNPQAAVREFEASLKLKDDPRVQLNLGDALLQLHQLDAAVGAYTRAIELDTASPAAHYSLGKAYALQQRREDARKEFHEALRLQPNFQPAALAIQHLNPQ